MARRGCLFPRLPPRHGEPDRGRADRGARVAPPLAQGPARPARAIDRVRTTYALKALRAVVLLALGLAAAVVPAVANKPPRPLSISAHHDYLEHSASADRLVEALRLGIDNIEIELGKPDHRRGPSRTRVEDRGSRTAARPAPCPPSTSAPGRGASTPRSPATPSRRRGRRSRPRRPPGPPRERALGAAAAPRVSRRRLVEVAGQRVRRDRQRVALAAPRQLPARTRRPAHLVVPRDPGVRQH